MTGILIATHGDLAEGLLNAIELLAGKQEKIETIGLLWSSFFVTLVAKKYRFMQFELDMVFDTR